ncbi:hypothetical protein QFZ49_003265 [Streptomyces turgidiscabies]|uniref:Transposase n=1 Tax=Streptomyces turgidiscabies TaxID=85558 RepID=A0ABU0RMW8_9ACTN|nr:hypothetical protein [Streptomyces turgidiscabies]
MVNLRWMARHDPGAADRHAIRRLLRPLNDAAAALNEHRDDSLDPGSTRSR